MKILFVTDGLFPFQIGGMQKHSSVLINHLAALGATLTVIHPEEKEYSSSQILAHFGDTTSIIFRPVPFIDNSRLPGHYVRANQRYSKRALETVRDILPQFDLIYAQGFTGRSFIEMRRQKQLKIPVVVNLHGFEMYQSTADLKHKIAYHWLRKEASFSLLNADYVYSFGAKLTQLLYDLGVSPDHILEQSNGIDDSWLTNNPSKNREIRTFVFIGRNERRKGMKELVAALDSLLRAGAVFKFHFIGAIAENEKLIHPNLVYHGAIRDPEKIRDILDQCDCLVVPSHSEGMPTVILEAMSRGLAVIGTNVGAVSRMIDGNGLLLERPDVRLISQSMRQLIEIPADELSLFKIRSMELVKARFRWSEIAKQKWDDFKRITGKS